MMRNSSQLFNQEKNNEITCSDKNSIYDKYSNKKLIFINLSQKDLMVTRASLIPTTPRNAKIMKSDSMNDVQDSKRAFYNLVRIPKKYSSGMNFNTLDINKHNTKSISENFTNIIDNIKAKNSKITLKNLKSSNEEVIDLIKNYKPKTETTNFFLTTNPIERSTRQRKTIIRKTKKELEKISIHKKLSTFKRQKAKVEKLKINPLNQHIIEANNKIKLYIYSSGIKNNIGPEFLTENIIKNPELMHKNRCKYRMIQKEESYIRYKVFEEKVLPFIDNENNKKVDLGIDEIKEIRVKRIKNIIEQLNKDRTNSSVK